MCRIASTFALAAGLLPGWLTAQTSPAAEPAVEEEIVVTATLEEEERSDVSATVRLVDAAAIAARQAPSVAQLFSAVPGLHAVPAGSPGQQTSVFVRGTESDQVLVLWNGIPLNDPYFGGFNWAFLPTEGVARVEVVPGPFSALYGSSAAGGVVQVLTGSRQGVRLDAEGGEHGYARLALAAGWPGERLGLDLSGHRREGGSELPNDDYEGRELAARLGWSVTPSTEVGLLGRWNDSQTGIPPSGIFDGPQRRIAWEETDWALPASAVAGAWSLESLLSQVRYDNAFRDPDDPFGFVAQDTDSRADRGRAVVRRQLSGGGWWAAGAEGERLEVSDRSNFGRNLAAAEQRTWAGFSQLHLEGERWGAELGVRHDDNDVYGGHTSPRLGAVVAVGRQLRLRGSYGEGFRAPSLGELFFPLFGNPDLRPERSESLEVAVEATPGAWRFGLTGFSTELEDLIDFDFATLRNVNVGRARSRGVEGSVARTLSRGRIELGGSRLEAESRDTGQPLLRRPEESAYLLVTLRPAAWTWSLHAQHVGTRPDVDPVTGARTDNPSYQRLDLAARWQARSWLAPYARVENLADQRYQPALGFPAPGRTLVAGVSVTR